MKALLCLLGFHKYFPEPNSYYRNRCVRCGHTTKMEEANSI